MKVRSQFFGYVQVCFVNDIFNEQKEIFIENLIVSLIDFFYGLVCLQQVNNFFFRYRGKYNVRGSYLFRSLNFLK